MFQAIILAGERRNGANGSSGLACELSGFLVRFLVALIFENYDSLKEMRLSFFRYKS
jgi:hypothetical protein